jgi:hypothetical protein
VADKIRNFYEVGEYKSDEVMNREDAAVASDLAKPDANGRRARTSKTAEPATRTRRTHDEVVAENQQKVSDYMEKCDEAIAEAAGDREAVSFDEAVAATENIPTPELETPPRRTRAERLAKEQEGDWQDNTDSVTVVLEKDSYFFRPSDGNYLMKHKGDSVDLVVGGERVLEEITQEQFGEGVKAMAQNPLEGAVNPPEQGRRTRRNKENAGADSAQGESDVKDVQNQSADTASPSAEESETRTRRTRRTR